MKPGGRGWHWTESLHQLWGEKTRNELALGAFMRVLL